MPRHRRHASAVGRARPWWGSGSAGATDVATATAPALTFGTGGALLDVRLYVAQGQDPNVDPDLWTWTETPQNYILWRDRIHISRGRSPGQTQANPSQMSLSLKDAQGRYIWPLGTAMRLDVNPGTGLERRYTGFVTTRNPRADVSGNDRWLQVLAAGPLQRLGRLSSPAHSTIWSITYGSASLATSLTGYAASFWWPLEDGAGATSAASAIVGGPSATTSGAVTFATATVPAGIEAAPTLTSAAIYGNALAATNTGAWSASIRFLLSGACTILRWLGSNITWEIRCTAGGAGLYAAGSLVTTLTGTDVTDSEWHSCAVNVDTTTAPGFATCSISVDGSIGTGSFVCASIGTISSVYVNPASSASMTSAAHVVGGPNYSPSDQPAFMAGYPIETAMSRFFRISDAEAIPVEVLGDDSVLHPGGHGTVDVNGRYPNTAQMGPQGSGTVLSIFRECEAAEDGILLDRISGRIGLDRHADRENQNVALTLRVGLGGNAQILPPFDPSVDDQRVANDMTVMASGGSQRRDVEDDLIRGVSGAGRYQGSLTLNVYDAQAAADHASFEVMRGTIDEPRIESVQFNLAKSPELIAAWLACDVGSRVVIQNLHGTILLSDADQLIEGYTEDIDQTQWIVTLSLSASAPYRTFVVGSDDENLGRVDNPGSKLVGAITDDATVATISVSSPGALWRTGPVSFPVAISGEPAERVEVTNISGGSSPQTFTIVRHAGDTVGHLNGASVTLWRPGVIALHSRTEHPQ